MPDFVSHVTPRELSPLNSLEVEASTHLVRERGYIPRDRQAFPTGFSSFARPLRDDERIPRNEWRDRIEHLETNGLLLSQRMKAAGLTVKDQDGLGYCWIFSPTLCLEVVRMTQGEPLVRLSPSSGGAIIKRWKNQGGWGGEALDFMAEHGLVPTEHWPDVSLEKKYDTPANDALRARFRALEWRDGDASDFDGLMSRLLHGKICSLGNNNWGHQYTVVDPVALPSGRFGVRLANSWGTQYGENGYAVFAEGDKYARPDDWLSCESAVPGA